MKLLSQTMNGQLTYCSTRNSYYLEFGTIFLTFTSEELQRFRNYIWNIDYQYYLQKNKDSFNRRKLLLQVCKPNTMFGVYENEFLELKNLLTLKQNSEKFIVEEFYDYHITLN